MSKSQGPKPGEFSVCQFFRDNSYEYVMRFIDAEAAVLLAKRLSTSVGGRLGTTQRIIITDGGDCTVFEWQFGKGVVFGLPGQLSPQVKEHGL